MGSLIQLSRWTYRVVREFYRTDVYFQTKRTDRVGPGAERGRVNYP